MLCLAVQASILSIASCEWLVPIDIPLELACLAGDVCVFLTSLLSPKWFFFCTCNWESWLTWFSTSHACTWSCVAMRDWITHLHWHVWYARYLHGFQASSFLSLSLSLSLSHSLCLSLSFSLSPSPLSLSLSLSLSLPYHHQKPHQPSAWYIHQSHPSKKCTIHPTLHTKKKMLGFPTNMNSNHPCHLLACAHGKILSAAQRGLLWWSTELPCLSVNAVSSCHGCALIESIAFTSHRAQPASARVRTGQLPVWSQVELLDFEEEAIFATMPEDGVPLATWKRPEKERKFSWQLCILTNIPKDSCFFSFFIPKKIEKKNGYHN